ncbi:MAG: ATP-grasp domain-containing protein [Pseudomonadota bacterium]
MQHCLVISRSARALTASALKANYVVHAIDAFADEDTCSMATTMVCNEFNHDSFEQSILEKNIDAILAQYPIEVCVVGSGTELNSALLMKHSNQFQLCMNQQETIDKVIDPFQLSDLCQAYDLPFPAISNNTCPDKNWLIKKIGSQGGEHVRWAITGEKPPIGSYLQEYQAGTSCSVVFFSDGERVELVGFNELIQLEYQNNPFLYAGAVSITPNKNERRTLRDIIDIIVKQTGLIGLCGMDYTVKDDGSIIVIEINPRPTATFELHEGELSLLQTHIDAFNHPISEYKRCHEYRGYVIIYAEQKISVSSEIHWPAWVNDRPASGSQISAGQPICSIHAEGNSTAEIKKLLSHRKQQMESTLIAMRV